MGKLIKFDYVNEHGDFEKVLSHFDIDYQKTGAQLRALCPLHEDTNPSLSVTLEANGDAKENTWHCFGCKQSGSIIDFVSLMIDGPLRESAELVAEISGCALAPPKSTKASKPQKARTGSKKAKTGKTPALIGKSRDAAPADAGATSEPNQPLKFKLPLDLEHEYVTGRVPPGLAVQFGLGVCDAESKSMMAGRCCVPIHNLDGELIAYAGRYLDDDLKEPKWLLPKGFEKQRCLFNVHRVVGAGTVVLVEGFFDAIRLSGLNVPAVACMGTAISQEQVALLRDLGIRKTVVLFDGDAEGQAAVPDAVLALSGSMFVRAGTLTVGDDPASVAEAELLTTLRELLV